VGLPYYTIPFIFLSNPNCPIRIECLIGEFVAIYGMNLISNAEGCYDLPHPLKKEKVRGFHPRSLPCFR
jgi:hypothetical protein